MIDKSDLSMAFGVLGSIALLIMALSFVSGIVQDSDVTTKIWGTLGALGVGIAPFIIGIMMRYLYRGAIDRRYDFIYESLQKCNAGYWIAKNKGFGNERNAILTLAFSATGIYIDMVKDTKPQPDILQEVKESVRKILDHCVKVTELQGIIEGYGSLENGLSVSWLHSRHACW